MPSNILNADTGFPSFTEDMTADQKIGKVMNYLYMLLEQLRYTLGNLDTGNFNETGLEEIGDLITKPVYAKLENELGDVTELRLEVDGLKSTVKGYEDQVSSFRQTVSGFNTTVQGYEGQVSQFEQTVSGFETTVKGYEGQVSEFEQTVSGFRLAVEGYEEKMSEILLLEDSISLVVSNGELNTASIVAAINDSDSEVMIRADKISMDGEVTFISSSKNSDGELEIDGNSLGMSIDGTRDNGVRDLKSTNGINYYYRYGGANEPIYKMGSIYAKIEGETSDISSRYSVCIDTFPFSNSNGQSVAVAMKLMATGRGSFEAKSLYLNGVMGYITLDAAFNTRIFATASYAQLQNAVVNGYPEAASATGYCFCTDGIYYDGVKILDV